MNLNIGYGYAAPVVSTYGAYPYASYGTYLLKK